MDREEDAEAAAKALNDTEFKGGNKIRVEADASEANFLRIFNLPFGTAWQVIKDLFAQYGRVGFAGIEGEDYKGKGKGKKGKKGKEKGNEKGKDSGKGKKGSVKGFSSAPKSWDTEYDRGFDSGKGKSKKGKSKGKSDYERRESRVASDEYGGDRDRRDQPRATPSFTSRPASSAAPASRPWQEGSGPPRPVFSSGAVATKGRDRAAAANNGRPGPTSAPGYLAGGGRRGDSRPRSRSRHVRRQRSDSRRRSRSRGRGGSGGGDSYRPPRSKGKGGGKGKGGDSGGGRTGEVRFEDNGSSEAVDAAIKQYHGKAMGGHTLVVERDAASQTKITVRNLPPDVDWPQLKDMFRKVGQVAFVKTR